MPTRSEAEENLRTIRSLMERSTIYRAISAPTALVGGLASVIACASFRYLFFNKPNTDLGLYFLCFWMVTLALTAAVNTWLIWRGAKLRLEPFISSGMKMALISLLPSMVCAGFFTCLFLYHLIFVWAFFLPPIWMICYGLGLLSTSHFAPRSIVSLGWVFLFSGFATYLYFQYCGSHTGGDNIWVMALGSNLAMGATFGLFHLIYAACTWPRKSTTTPSISGDEP